MTSLRSGVKLGLMKKENFKKSFDFKIVQNLEFFHEYSYIYKKNKLFNQLFFKNQDLYDSSKNKKEITNTEYKKLYKQAVNISYGIDHIGNTDGLFTKKIKKPTVGSRLEKGDFQYIDFDCGDLYLRKNVILKNDNIHCYKFFSQFVDKISVKLNKFRWGMNYSMPSSKKEISKLIKTQTKKHCLHTGPVWINTIQYNFDMEDIKDNILYLTADLIWTDLKAVVKLSKKLFKLKKIIFVDYNIWFKPKQLGDIDIRRYIINDCGNGKFKWWCSAPRLKNSPHLEKLKVFRKNIDKKIKIEFYNNDYDIEVGDYYKDDCQEILVNAKII